MRFKELLEYKRDITATNHGDKLLPRLIVDTSFIRFLQTKIDQPMDSNYQTEEGWFENWMEENSEKVIELALQAMESSDPTPNKQYTEWLIRRYIDGSISRFEDVLSTTADMLERYHTLKVHRKLPSALMDIGKVKTKGQISDLDFSVSTAYNEFIKDKPEVISKGDANEILNNSEVRIIIPNDEESACYYGQGTQWCTAAKKNNMFNNYHSHNHPLFILLPKNPTHTGEKYQVHLLENEWMDETDTEVLPREVIERFANTDLKSVFEKYDTDANSILEFLSWDVIENSINEITKIIVNNKDKIINDWIDDSIQANVNAHSKIIDQLRDNKHIADEIMALMTDGELRRIDDGGWRMKLYELPDAYAKWLMNEFHIDGGIYDFVYDHIEATVDSKGQPIVRIFQRTTNR